MQRPELSIFVVITYTLLTYNTAVFWWVIVISRNWFASMPTLLISLAYTLQLAMVGWTYNLACNTKPGSPTSDWEPNDISAEELAQIKERSSLHRSSYRDPIRWCKTCKCWKPPRCHHCSVCKSCVLRMDHHCVWLDNCVGHRNHKYFLQFLFYCCTSAIETLLIILWELAHSFIYTDEWMDIPLTNWLCVFIDGVFAVLVIMGVSTMLFQQLMIVKDNKTNIEMWERHWAVKDFGSDFLYPYDKGTLNNLKEYLGENVMQWLVPTAVTGTGLDYPPMVSREMALAFRT